LQRQAQRDQRLQVVPQQGVYPSAYTGWSLRPQTRSSHFNGRLLTIWQ
jgi:hypothetical protein